MYRFLSHSLVSMAETVGNHIGVPKIKGYHFEGPNNKDFSILGSRLGSPYFGKLPYCLA